jgi:hypothetical protein
MKHHMHMAKNTTHGQWREWRYLLWMVAVDGHRGGPYGNVLTFFLLSNRESEKQIHAELRRGGA